MQTELDLPSFYEAPIRATAHFYDHTGQNPHYIPAIEVGSETVWESTERIPLLPGDYDNTQANTAASIAHNHLCTALRGLLYGF